MPKIPIHPAHKIIIARILDYCEGFETLPMRGMAREDLLPGLRTVGFERSATILFTVSDAEVTIQGIYYRGQDFETRIGS